MIWGTDSKRAGRKWSSSGLPCCRQNDLIPLGRVNRMTAGVEEIIVIPSQFQCQNVRFSRYSRNFGRWPL